MNRNTQIGMTHTIPVDIKKLLDSSLSLQRVWKDITPLARNEWVCWIISAKMIDTRARRLRRMREELLEGKRRPCCWAGCMHRGDKQLSPSQKFVLRKQMGER